MKSLEDVQKKRIRLLKLIDFHKNAIEHSDNHVSKCSNEELVKEYEFKLSTLEWVIGKEGIEI